MFSLRSKILPLTAVIGLSLFLTGSVLSQPPASAGAATAKQAKGKKGNKGRSTPLQQGLATLTLTAEQKAKITPLTDKFKEETKSPTMTPAVKREKSKQLLADVKAVLTPEQQTKLAQSMARISGPMAAAARQLKLTPAQRTKVMPIAQKANEDIAKLNEDKALKGKAKQAKVQTIVKAAVIKIKAEGGLTDAQKTELDTIASKIGQRKGGKMGKGAGKGGAAAPK